MRLITERRDAATYRKGNTSSVIEFVLIVMWVHLFPSRTQKLSTCTPTIVAGRLAVKIGNANIKPRSKGRGFFLPASVHWTLADGRTIVSLAVKIGNANTRSLDESRGFFLPGSVHRTVAKSRLSSPTRKWE